VNAILRGGPRRLIAFEKAKPDPHKSRSFYVKPHGCKRIEKQIRRNLVQKKKRKRVSSKRVSNRTFDAVDKAGIGELRENESRRNKKEPMQESISAKRLDGNS